MQPAERIVRIEHSVRVLPPQIVFHIFARQRRPAAKHWEIELLPLQILDHILHLQRRFHQQPAQPDGIGFVFLCGLDNRVRRLLDPEVHHTKTIVRQNDVDQILADVVDVAFHSRQNDGRFLRSCFLLHLRFEISDRLLHYSCRIEHRRELHFSRSEQVSDGLHSIQKNRVYEIERGVLHECFFK